MKNTMIIRSSKTKVDVFSSGLTFEEAVDMLTDAINMVCVSQGRNERHAQNYVVETLIDKLVRG